MPSHRISSARASFISAMAVFAGCISATTFAQISDKPLTTIKSTQHAQPLQRADLYKHGITNADLDPFRAVLRKAVNDHTIPGVSLLLAHKSEVIFKEAFGDMSVDQKAFMAPSSKPLTATVVMILVDQGKLGLDDSLEKYLPEFKGITINDKVPMRVPTVRHVLCNMSGLPGDFLAELMLKRLGKRAGKVENDAGEGGVSKGNLNSGILPRGNRSLVLCHI